MSDLSLYKVLYSIGKESCTGCEETIETGRIQIAITEQLPDNSYEYDWYHTECFFADCLPSSESDIEGFSALKLSDQESIKKQLAPKDSNNWTEETMSTENVSKRDVECAVDPDSEMQDYTHVYCKTDEYNRKLNYSVTLTNVDIEQLDQNEEPLNEFHRMQLLQANDYEYYWVFQSFGSIASVAECSKITSNYENRADAVEKFETVYRNKTGNNFGAICFANLPQRFYNLDVVASTKDQNRTPLPELSLPVQLLMQMILDGNQSSKKPVAPTAQDLIANRLPLGHLSVNQIFDAMVTLERIISAIKTTHGDVDENQVIKDLNEFYRMIPRLKPPKNIIKFKWNLEIQILNALWGEQIYMNCRDNDSENVNLSALYKFLNSEIKPLDENDGDLDQIRKIVENTHSPQHDEYTLSVLEVYNVMRQHEELRFRAYEHLPNRRLLWHGTRMENFVEILLHGLKIAPGGSHSNGNLFGKGIYFADVVSKSANYCDARETGDIRLMLLCEVALGKSRNINGNTYQPVKGMPNATYQSVKGCGATVPTQSSTIDGVEIASGPLRKSTFNGLLHNEYVVYDPAQIKVKHIVKVMYDFKPVKLMNTSKLS